MCYIFVMASIPPVPPAGFDSLTAEQQLDYVRKLWSLVLGDPERIPIPDWQLAILRDRRNALERDGDPGRAWEKVREELDRRLRDLRR